MSAPPESPGATAREGDVRPPEAEALPDWPCYLDGQFTTLRQARVSVLDRGFIFGDGVYEVLPVYEGRIFRFEEHMARLARSLDAVRIPHPQSREAWLAVARRLAAGHAACTSSTSQLIYLQVTRGVALRDHAMLPGLTPTVFAMCSTLRPASEAQRREGVACVTADDFRWRKAHIKSTSLQGAVIARQIGVDAGVVETVMFRDGWLSEAASSNVWVVQGGAVIGPPNDDRVLQGIRYDLLRELCADEGIPFSLRPVARDEVLAADELMLSSASKEVLPVTLLDGRAVGSGRPGPVYARLYAAYQRAKREQSI